MLGGATIPKVHNLQCRIIQKGVGGGKTWWPGLWKQTVTRSPNFQKDPVFWALLMWTLEFWILVFALPVGHFLIYIVRVEPSSTEGHISIMVALQGQT